VSEAGQRPIGAYAALGDGRSAALVALDGSVEWWCTPEFSSPSVLAAMLDGQHGGAFTLAPVGDGVATRSYVPGTNVLRTEVRSSGGVLQTTDALVTHPPEGCAQVLVRRLKATAGTVCVRWRFSPRPGYGQPPEVVTDDDGHPVLGGGDVAMRVCSWSAGDVGTDAQGVGGEVELRAGDQALVAVVIGADGREWPPVPSRDVLEHCLDATCAHGRRWLSQASYDGPWQSAVERSALVLELMVQRSNGAMVAAPTTSLPEQPGGELNWDYRYAWLRDASLSTDALVRLGRDDIAAELFAFLVNASEASGPTLQPMYAMDGSAELPEGELPLAGWRGSRPVRVGNAAADQRQLGSYGDLLQTAWLLHRAGHVLQRPQAARLSTLLDHLCSAWRHPDAGIWESRGDPQQYTHSKIMCWVAFDRGMRLARAGQLPRGSAWRWAEQGHAARSFVEERCWSPERQAYTAAAGESDLDAAVLLGLSLGFAPGDDPRVVATLDAIRAELTVGAFTYRKTGSQGTEGAFLACSFWMAEALHRAGRHDAARAMMDDLVAAANDVGLLSEEIDPADGQLLGNFPQALTHLSLVNAALTLGGDRDDAADHGPT